MTNSVSTPDERLEHLEKPGLEIRENFEISKGDFLILCAGFEERALAVLKNTPLPNGFNVVLIHYKPFINENKAPEIESTCKGRGINLLELNYNREDPIGFGRELVEIISECKGRIFIDISAMSRLLIVQTLVALKKNRLNEFSDCFLTYAEARVYPPSEAEAAKELAKVELDSSSDIYFLSSGVFGVTIIPELSSYSFSGVQTRLIAFPSLDSHQLTALRVELQPSRFSFIEGIPPAPHNQWRKKAIADINHLTRMKDAEFYPVSTLDYRETLSCLQKLYVKYGIQERLLIAPIGSKMQAVGVGIFRAFVEDIQIVYPTPQEFQSPGKYTQGIGKMYQLPLEGFSNQK